MRAIFKALEVFMIFFIISKNTVICTEIHTHLLDIFAVRCGIFIHFNKIKSCTCFVLF